MVVRPSRNSAPLTARALAGRGRWSLVAWMLLAIAAVTALAWWDEEREDSSAIRDLESEQAMLASTLAAGLRDQLAAVRRDALIIGELGPGPFEGRYSPVSVRPVGTPRARTPDPARRILSVSLPEGRVVDVGLRIDDLVRPGAGMARRSDVAVLVATPDDTALDALDGRRLESASLVDALHRGLMATRLSRAQAAEIGLPARTSVAGFARVEAGELGPWGVVSIASVARERDRQKRAQTRLVLSVLVASGLVLAFGGAALRKQRKELELERELTVAEAQRLRDEELLRAERVATMGTFAMGIAHEVSTPLGIIVGRAEQLSHVQDERASRNAHGILKQAERIQQIVRRFLDMARGGPPSLERTDPGAIVESATSAVKHRFAKARVTLSADLPLGMPAIRCDKHLLEQAIVNLLLNACEACGPGGRVEVVARVEAERIVFVVNDDGTGISPEDAARATEPFFTTDASGSGAGLGLAIASEIVKSHRGSLTIGPRGDRGTCAQIAIPIPARALEVGERGLG